MKIFDKSTLIMFIGCISLMMLSSSCSDEIDFVHLECNNDEFIEIPMNLDLSIEGTGRAESYQWQDGAILLIIGKCESSGDNITFYSVYSDSKGWTAHINFDDYSRIVSDNITILYTSYSEYWNYNRNKVFEDLNYSKCPANYAFYHYDYTIDTHTVIPNCTFENDKLSYSGILYKAFGRVRFVSYTLPSQDVLYNHAKTYRNGQDYREAFYIDVLNFTQGNDGNYYSDYLYVKAIPELKIGDYVYRYKGNPEIAKGASGVITLPIGTASSNTWHCEKYFEIIHNSDVAVEIDGEIDDKMCFNLYSLKNCGLSFPLNEWFKTQIGVNITINFTIDEHTGKDMSLWSNSLKCTGNEFYQGKEYYMINETYGTKRLHVCDDITHEYYSTVIRGYASDEGANNETKAKLTLHYVKITNF